HQQCVDRLGAGDGLVGGDEYVTGGGRGSDRRDVLGAAVVWTGAERQWLHAVGGVRDERAGARAVGGRGRGAGRDEAEREGNDALGGGTGRAAAADHQRRAVIEQEAGRVARPARADAGPTEEESAAVGAAERAG